MRIAILSDLEARGGAALAASRLATGLIQAGQTVTRLVAQPSEHKHEWPREVLTPGNPFRNQIIRKFLPAQSRTRWDEKTARQLLDQTLSRLKPDVINVHNLHWAAWLGWNPQLLEICVAHAPTVWTLHDMWSFTGRCANNDQCQKFPTGCDAACPTPGEYPPLAPELIAGAWAKRQQLFQSHPQLAAITPSQWMAEEAQRGLWKNHRVEVIANGLPLSVFTPIDRTVARQALGITGEGPVLLMAAQTIGEKRKGGQILVDALKKLSLRPLTLLTLGSGQLSLNEPGIFNQPLGHIDHERSLALAYSAADLFVHPSTGDNLPNVIAEALACGTPVAAFPIGGVPEMVLPGTTGWLAKAVSAEALADVLNRALEELRQGTDLRASCRATAESLYSLPLQVQRYESIFASLIEAAKK